jgi:tetratricopeptide (TPR) repeat protein
MTGRILLIGWLFVCLAGGPGLFADEKSDIRKAESLYQKGVKKAQDKKFDEAGKFFTEALQVYPLLPGAYVELGQLAMMRQEYETAVAFYQRAEEAYLALHDKKLKELQKTQNQTLDQIQRNDDHFGAGARGGGGFARSEGLAAKDNRLRDRRQVIAENLEAEIPALLYLYLGGAHLRLGELGPAEQELLKGIHRDPELAPLHFNLAIVYLSRGEYQKSAESARTARDKGFQIPPAFIQDLETRGNLKF